MTTIGESIIGHEAKLFIGKDGDRAAASAFPTSFSEIVRAMDVELTLGSNTGTFGSRISNFQSQKVALEIAGLTFGYEYSFGSTAGVHSDAVFEELKNAYFLKTIFDWYVLDGPETVASKSSGIRFFGQISEMNETQPLEDAVVFDFTVTPVRFADPGDTSTLFDPEFYNVPDI